MLHGSGVLGAAPSEQTKAAVAEWRPALQFHRRRPRHALGAVAADSRNTFAYMSEVLERAAGRHRRPYGTSADEFYFYWLATFHEGMHAEALAYTRQTLVIRRRILTPVERAAGSQRLCPATSRFPVASSLSARQRLSFVFDNEKWAHGSRCDPFRIARAPVTNGEFLEFVEARRLSRGRHTGAPRAGDGWKPAAPAVGKILRQVSSTKALMSAPEIAEFKKNSIIQSTGNGSTTAAGSSESTIAILSVERRPAGGARELVRSASVLQLGHRRLPTEAEWEVAASAEPTAGGGCATDAAIIPWGDVSAESATANLDWHAAGIVEVGVHRSRRQRLRLPPDDRQCLGVDRR